MALLELSQLLEFSTPDSLHIASPASLQLPHLPESADAVFALALPQRPALQVAKLRTEAAKMGVKVAHSGYLPTLSPLCWSWALITTILLDSPTKHLIDRFATTSLPLLHSHSASPSLIDTARAIV